MILFWWRCRNLNLIIFPIERLSAELTPLLKKSKLKTIPRDSTFQFSKKVFDKCFLSPEESLLRYFQLQWVFHTKWIHLAWSKNSLHNKCLQYYSNTYRKVNCSKLNTSVSIDLKLLWDWRWRNHSTECNCLIKAAILFKQILNRPIKKKLTIETAFS